MYKNLVTLLRKKYDKAPMVMEAADAIEELLQKEKFHAFLWNVINPNDMQLYLEMYHSGNEKEDAG